MNNRIKNIYIPKLRFKGFADLLIRKKLNDICIIKKGDQINNSELKESGLYYYQNGGIEPSGWLDNFNNEGNAISISEGGESCGFIKWHDLPFWSGGHLYTLDINDKNINKKYIYFLLKANQKFIMKLRNGSSIPNIQKQDLNKFFLFHSNNLNEQEKIAKFFSLLDQQLSLLENKLQLIEQKFKYFLNGLFNLHNEKSILRFKTFNNKWRLKKIEEITTFMKSGGTPKSRSDLFYSNNGIPFLAIPDMKNKYLLKTDKHITNLAVEKTSTFIFEKDNLVYSIYATIGEISINKIDVALPQSILGIKADKTVIKNEYLYYLLKSNKNKILRLKQTGSQPNLSLEIFKNISLYISLNLEEQSKISKFLNLFDLWKETVKNNIYLVKKRKEHFLKQMF